LSLAKTWPQTDWPFLETPKQGAAGERELRDEDQLPPRPPRIRPRSGAKLKEPETKERKFEDVVKSAAQAAVLVLVY
jgi:hypothetical protein